MEELSTFHQEGKRHPKARPKTGQDVRRDRKSATGMIGAPKKGGHGGKFTWSGDRLLAEETGFNKGVVDTKDPNFEDPKEADALYVMSPAGMN